MKTKKAIDIAKWFIKNGYDSPRNTFDGNMKLQKMLYFSQLIHVAKFNKLLFKEEMRAYENGTVINDVRLPYKNSLYLLIDEANKFDGFDDVEVNETLNLTTEIFGDMSARELSDLNHELISWKIPYHSSKTDNPNRFDSEKNIIDVSDKFFMDDVNKIKQMLSAYEESDDSMVAEVINGVTFYYNPQEIELTEDDLILLEGLNCPDEAYTITKDDEQGLVIY